MIRSVFIAFSCITLHIALTSAGKSSLLYNCGKFCTPNCTNPTRKQADPTLSHLDMIQIEI